MTAYVTFYLDDSKPPKATLITGSGHAPFVRVELVPGVKAFVLSRAQCDAAIEAFTAARDLLPAPECAGQLVLPCSADWGSATASQSCTRPAGHDGNHIDSAGYAWGGSCGPGSCTCGAHVDADGVVTPAAAP